MKRIVILLLCLIATLASLPGQETIYFAAGLDQEGLVEPLIPGAGRMVTRVTLDNPGPVVARATIRFIAEREVPAAIPMLGAIAANCGPGCFHVDVPPQGNFSGETPGTDPGKGGYVKVTADPGVTTSVELHTGDDCVTSVPGTSTFHTGFTFPVSWTSDGESDTGHSNLISLILPGQGAVLSGVLRDTVGDVVDTVENGAEFVDGGVGFEILGQRFSDVDLPFEGQLQFESAVPIVAFVGHLDFAALCVSFPEQPVQTSPSRVLNLPSVVQAPGISTRLILGGVDIPFSANTTFSDQDGSEISSQSVDVPAHGTTSIDFSGGKGLKVGSLTLGIDPPEAHVLLTEVISLGNAPPIGVSSAPLCTTAEFLVVQNDDNHTGGAFSNPFSTVEANCAWEVHSEDGSQLGDGTFDIQPSGRQQFFPDERVQLPDDFEGIFRTTCNVPIYVFSLFQRRSDNALSSNSAGCLE